MSVRPSNVTLADVAKLVGVSAVTVSNVVNSRGGVSEQVRKKVWAAIEETGYVANLAARSLAGGKTNTIGVLVPDLTTQYGSEIIRGISEQVRDSGMELLISTAADISQERGRTNFLKKITDGLIFLLPHEIQDDFRAVDLTGMPVVMMEHPVGNVSLPTVNVDDYEGTRNAVAYLLKLNHRHIGFIGGLSSRVASETRLKAYRAALQAAGVDVDERLVLKGDFTQLGGFTAACELLLLPDPPTAIFAANDLSAFGVMEAVKHHGLRIPEDVSIVGFDDIPMASQVFPPLTTVRRPLAQMGVTAVKMLLARLSGERFDSHVTLPTSLVVRATTQSRRKLL